MPIPTINAYLDSLNVRITENKQMLADAMSIPHMKEKHRRSTLNAWSKIVNNGAPQNKKPASSARLKMMGIGVRHV